MAGPDDDPTYLADNQELEKNRIDHPQPRNFGLEENSLTDSVHVIWLAVISHHEGID